MASGQYVNLRVTNKMVLPVNTNLATINGQSLIELRESVNIAIIGLTDGDKGDITVSGSGTVWTIDNDVVTFAKMQNISTDVLLGRDTALSGNTEEISVGGGIEFTGTSAIQISAFTGDATKALGGTVLTLATVNASVGTFGTATQVGTFTVNAKGLITSASNTSILITQSQVSSLTTDLALKAPLANPTFTGTVTIPNPFTIGATSMLSTGTQLNYLSAAAGTTGTTNTNVVFSASPALTGTVTVTNTTDITLGAESALRVGGAANSTNITMGEYSSVLGIQGRNNSASANIFLQPLGGGVSVGDGSLTGQRIFAVNNTGAGTGDYASIEVRNGSAGTDALRLWCMGTGFTASGSNVQDAAIVTAGTGLSGGMSLGALANAPVRLYSNNANWFTLLANGNFVGVSTGALGYGTGAGGTVTQATSKATGVTLNKLSGEITLNNAVLNAGTIVSFTLTNSTLTATDVLVLNHVTTGTLGAYTLNAQCNAGTATISVRNNTAGNLTEAIVIRYATIKGSTN